MLVAVVRPVRRNDSNFIDAINFVPKSEAATVSPKRDRAITWQTQQ